jgi:hypothetical protein
MWTGQTEQGSEQVNEQVNNSSEHVHIRVNRCTRMYAHMCSYMYSLCFVSFWTCGRVASHNVFFGSICCTKKRQNRSARDFLIMADLAEAPEPPTGWTKPPGYLALRCQFCLCWSTMKTPFTHHRAKQCKFYPLIAWYQGSRENPVGFICLICVNVHSPALVCGSWFSM